MDIEAGDRVRDLTGLKSSERARARARENKPREKSSGRKTRRSRREGKRAREKRHLPLQNVTANVCKEEGWNGERRGRRGEKER